MTMTLTDNAATEIRHLVSAPEVPADAGIRIADAGDGALTLSLTGGPDAGDEVIENDGARVFVEPAAGHLLGDKTLDAGVDPQGQVQFTLGEQ